MVDDDHGRLRRECRASRVHDGPHRGVGEIGAPRVYSIERDSAIGEERAVGPHLIDDLANRLVAQLCLVLGEIDGVRFQPCRHGFEALIELCQHRAARSSCERTHHAVESSHE